jgi:Fe-S-cluster containining protein
MATKETTRKECAKCPALCCKNLSIRILRPRTRAEINDLRWQLHFDTVKIYIRGGRWYQLVEGRCVYLDDRDRCRIYSERPEICRRHNPPDCEFFGEFYDIMIETPAELEAYLRKEQKLRRRATAA